VDPRVTSPGTIRKSLRAVRRRLRPSDVERRVGALGLTTGDVALDCGANVGDVTAVLAATGATVHAFEPNPDAFEVLSERFGEVENVSLHEEAVLDRTGQVRLYLHADADDDPIAASAGSSLLPFKYNVDPSTYITVEALDLAEFVTSLERPVDVVKLDVEGVECRVVNRLLDTGAIARVGTMLVELHDRHIPQLRSQYDALRVRIESEGLADRVFTDWH
jgi:FkbM family methyltransferase